MRQTKEKGVEIECVCAQVSGETRDPKATAMLPQPIQQTRGKSVPKSTSPLEAGTPYWRPSATMTEEAPSSTGTSRSCYFSDQVNLHWDAHG